MYGPACFFSHLRPYPASYNGTYESVELSRSGRGRRTDGGSVLCINAVISETAPSAFSRSIHRTCTSMKPARRTSFFRAASVVSILLLTLAAYSSAPMTATAQDASSAPDRTVTVSGEGQASAAPDRATVRFGIVTRAQEAPAAREQNADAAARAMNAVRELGVDDEDLRMESLTLQRRTRFNPDTRQQEDLGYEATRQVVVDVTDLEMLPRLIARVVDRGANRLDGIQYELSDEASVRNEALRKAAENARDKARTLAETLGAELGPVRQINEQNFSAPRPQRMMAMDAMSAKQESDGNPDAYAAGRIEIDVTIQVAFELR